MSHITQEQILNFAKESGFKFKNFNPPIIAVSHSNGSWISVSDELTAFANLVVAALAQPLPKASDKAAHELEVSLLLSTINMLTAKERDRHGENFGVVVGFTDEGLALVDYPSEGNTISLEEGMILYPMAAAKGAQPEPIDMDLAFHSAWEKHTSNMSSEFITSSNQNFFAAGFAAAAKVAQPEPHPDDKAVDAMAAAMKAKLATAREKGRGGWETCSQQDLSRLLREHVEKGDPRDVANFCAFLYALGFGIAQPEPVSLTDEQILALNTGEVFFSESPSKYPECGHGTQYHAGAPGVVSFARAVLAAAKGGAL